MSSAFYELAKQADWCPRCERGWSNPSILLPSGQWVRAEAPKICKASTPCETRVRAEKRGIRINSHAGEHWVLHFNPSESTPITNCPYCGGKLED